MKHEEEKETDRMIKEFKFKHYKRRFNVEITIALPAIFGAYKGEKILIKIGLLSNAEKKSGGSPVFKKTPSYM